MSRSKMSRPHAGRKGPRRARVRAVWFALAAVAVLGAALFLATAPFRPPAATVPPGETGQQVLVSMGGFEPSRLRGRTGEDVILTFVNNDSSFHTDGGGWHQFHVEALDLDVRIPPKSQKTVNLGRLRAGSYVFYCDICCGGKENPTMRGLLEVEG